MEVGDLICWSWHLGAGWNDTEFTGIVLGSRIAKTDYEKIRMFEVLVNDGTVLDVREDEPSAQVISENR